MYMYMYIKVQHTPYMYIWMPLMEEILGCERQTGNMHMIGNIVATVA